MIRYAAAIALFAAAAQADVTAHGVSAFGALKYPSDFEHYDYVNPEAPKGGVYTGRSTFAARTFDSLNPFILKGEAAFEVAMFVFDSLLTRAWDEPDAMYGLLAESVTYPENRAWAEFQMRPEATFADGTPVTADDVVFSLEVLKEKGSPTYKTAFSDLEGAEALGEHRVRFTFREGAATRDLPMLAGSVPVFSRAFWDGKDFAESSLEPPLGSGPYEVGDVQPGRAIAYVRRDDYWAKDLPVNRGKWNFGELRYEYFKDSTAAFEAFKAGEYEIHEEFFSKLWATAYDFPALEKGWVLRDVLPDGRPSGTQGYWFNIRREKFQDPKVREALALGFDFEWSNRTLFYDLYKRTDSFFEGSPLEAAGMPTEAEMVLLDSAGDLPAGATAEAYVPPKTDGSGRLRRLLRRAGKMLDEAGWPVGADGVRQKGGKTLDIEFLSNSPAFERITGPYIKNLRLMGVDAEYRQIDSAQYQQRQEDFDYDVIVARLPIQAVPGTELRNLWHSLSADGRGSLNQAGVADPAIDALIEAVIAAETVEAHATAVSALDRALRAMHIWVPQWTKGSHTIAYWDKFGRPEHKPPFNRGIVETWWVDDEKAEALKAAQAE
ncbi:MAG: extracellular solute-binding protein [Pseudomonadota bacterium]